MGIFEWLIRWGPNAIYAFLALGLLIFIHELGHFLAAKWCGIRVEKFSIGFGPAIISFRRHETDYCLSLLPFGGYVKMAGENPEERTSGDRTPSAENPTGEFDTATVGRRMLVAIAGPLANILLAVLAFAIFYMIGGEGPIRNSATTTVIGYVMKNSPAEKFGVRVGDQIIAINREPHLLDKIWRREKHRTQINKWEDLHMEIALAPNTKLDIELIRNQKNHTIPVTPAAVSRGSRKIGRLGVSPAEKLLVHQSWHDQIQKGDIVDTINGQIIYHSEMLYDLMAKHSSKIIKLGLVRDGKPIIIDTKLNQSVNVYPESGSAAERAGIKPGDQILKVNGKSPINIGNTGTTNENEPTNNRNKLPEKINEALKHKALTNSDQPLELDLLRPTKTRENEVITIAIAPEIKNDTTDMPIIYTLKNIFFPSREKHHWPGLHFVPGISEMELVEPSYSKTYNLFTAWGRSIEECYSTIFKIVITLQKLVTGHVSPKLLSGPIGILRITAIVAQSALTQFIWFVAFISINLGIVNLFPLPITDGGLILFFTIEKLRGKPLSLRTQSLIQQISFAFIALFFLFVTFYDVWDFFPSS